ncbi:MAG: bifunctional demethylmenaquinone methyltransferase/2-methoxy-6-polyprenyl-1,4-benzoquinol methylase UbiE [Pseudomonadota bacterium]|nr:bifunctional demethylmenaquinone methyltransferase/2-methoxy-6-polyprenyl-1,4-benzoquinol methylase UbiE [Pseudomonadota bacterium]
MELTKDPQKIRSMFGSIASRYDMANTILSGGIHHLWRRELVRLSQAERGFRVLDCATGTGDLAFEFKKQVGIEGQVIGCDFCEEMLSLARLKSHKRSLSLVFELADVTKLSYPNACFDVASIAFGIRNVSNPLMAISELARVVRPGGKIMILEFGQPETPVFKQIYELYSKYLMPRLGGMISGSFAAYKYLQTSSSHFPCREEFLAMMMSTKLFSRCEYKSLSGGIAYIYSGYVGDLPQH